MEMITLNQSKYSNLLPEWCQLGQQCLRRSPWLKWSFTVFEWTRSSTANRPCPPWDSLLRSCLNSQKPAEERRTRSCWHKALPHAKVCKGLFMEKGLVIDQIHSIRLLISFKLRLPTDESRYGCWNQRLYSILCEKCTFQTTDSGNRYNTRIYI